MSGVFSTLLLHEGRLQYRYGIYAAYGFVIAFYVGALIWLGPYLPPWFPALTIYTDPAAVGFFFLGGLMMLEKAEGVRLALSVTPVSAAQVFWAKTFPLTGLALLSVSVLTPFLHHGTNWALLMVAVGLTSVSMLGIGIPIALHFRTVTSYLMGSTGLLVPIIGPGLIAFSGDVPAWLLAWPTVSQARLVMVATGAADASPVSLAVMLAVAGLAAAGGAWLGIWRLDRELERR